MLEQKVHNAEDLKLEYNHKAQNNPIESKQNQNRFFNIIEGAFFWFYLKKHGTV